MNEEAHLISQPPTFVLSHSSCEKNSKDSRSSKYSKNLKTANIQKTDEVRL